MGRPPIGKRAMTPAERQRRHRVGLSVHDAKPVTKPDKPVTKPKVTEVPATDAIPLLSMREIEQWADELEIESQNLNRLMKLLWRNDLELWRDDPKENAHALLRQLGYSAVYDVYEALGEVLDEADETPEG